MEYVITDVETTGLRNYNSRIVEVAAVVLADDLTEVDRFSSLVNPGKEALRLANPKAMEVNKLTIEELEQAPRSDDVAEAFWGFLDRHKKGTVHSFNKHFDHWFLDKAPWNIPISRWGECVMLAAMDVMEMEDALATLEGGSLKFPSLKEAALFFGVPFTSKHRAAEDSRTAADIYIKILNRRRSCPNEADLQQEARYMYGEGL